MNVFEVAYQKNREFHTNEFRNLGPTTEVLWKGGAKSQRDRFAQIVRLLPDLSNKSILDVGCGFGDLFAYVSELGCENIEYCGIDLCGEMIDECRRRHPHHEFHETGVAEFAETSHRFDFVVASGVFAMPMPEWQSYVVQTVKRMFQLARTGVVANFLSDFSQAPSPKSHYANPGQTLEILMRNVSPWALLAHDYRWNDFAISLVREPVTQDFQQFAPRRNCAD